MANSDRPTGNFTAPDYEADQAALLKNADALGDEAEVARLKAIDPASLATVEAVRDARQLDANLDKEDTSPLTPSGYEGHVLRAPLPPVDALSDNLRQIEGEVFSKLDHVTVMTEPTRVDNGPVFADEPVREKKSSYADVEEELIAVLGPDGKLAVLNAMDTEYPVPSARATEYSRFSVPPTQVDGLHTMIPEELEALQERQALSTIPSPSTRDREILEEVAAEHKQRPTLYGSSEASGDIGTTSLDLAKVLEEARAMGDSSEPPAPDTSIRGNETTGSRPRGDGYKGR